MRTKKVIKEYKKQVFLSNFKLTSSTRINAFYVSDEKSKATALTIKERTLHSLQSISQ